MSMLAATLLRPQPVGLFDGPAGLLLVGDGDGVAELLAGLALGRLPEVWPPGAAALAAALAGDVDAALASLGDTPVDAVNRFVLAPTDEHHRAAVTAAVGDSCLSVVVDAAAFASGRADVAPAAEGLDAELAALALTVAASAALERHDGARALTLLRQAAAAAEAAGPALHARQLATLAEHQHQLAGPGDEVLELYGRAVAGLTGSDLHVVRAGVQLQHGVVAHQLADGRRHLLVEAIRSYQSALMVLREDEHPEAFAFANMHAALAILALPTTQASDQVRLGVAVQSLRAALRVYRPGTDAASWSAAQLNLANALQYLPSRHREDNLAEAVQLYEALLEVRSPHQDPVGYARVLANQANALAHLGVFDHARAKYEEARELFGRAGDADAVAVVDCQLDQIAGRQDGDGRQDEER